MAAPATERAAEFAGNYAERGTTVTRPDVLAIDKDAEKLGTTAATLHAKRSSASAHPGLLRCARRFAACYR
jgi:hypothetical protein